MAEISFQKLRDEIIMKLEHDQEVRVKSNEFANSVAWRWVDIWRSMGPHPYETGDYEDSIVVIKRFLRERQGRVPKGHPSGRGGQWTKEVLYAYSVGTDNDHAHLIEYGSGPDINGIGRWFGLDGRWHKSPKTPTPPFAPAAATAASFGGTMD